MVTVVDRGRVVESGGVVVDSDIVVEHDIVVVEHDMAPDPPPAEGAWYEPLAFGGPLDPAGTLFAFALSVAATVGLVVLVAAVVRVVTGA
jgi:hypothetical protein